MPKEKGKRRSGPTQGSTRGRPQCGIEQTQAADFGESSTTASSTAGVNYADLSTEVLHLLLAQRNLAFLVRVILFFVASPITMEQKSQLHRVPIRDPAQHRNTHPNLSARLRRTLFLFSATFWPNKTGRRQLCHLNHRRCQVFPHKTLQRRLWTLVIHHKSPASFRRSRRHPLRHWTSAQVYQKGLKNKF
jgi:hypothetical protein